jgi:hypothetical protein
LRDIDDCHTFVMMGSRVTLRARFASCAVLGAFVLCQVPASAQAPDDDAQTVQCLNLHEKAQKLRKSGALLQSRVALLSCAGETCPTMVRQDCIELLRDLERDIPSVSFELLLNGKDIDGAKFSDGDKPVVAGSKGVPYDVDPGVHKFKAEVPGVPAIETTEIVREGEKNRVVRFVSNVPAAASPLPAGERPVPPATWVFGAAAIAAVGAGAILGYTAENNLSQLTCKPYCTSSDVAPVRTMAAAADASFGGAILLAGIAGAFFFSRPVVTSEKQTTYELQPAAVLGAGFGGVSLRGSF